MTEEEVSQEVRRLAHALAAHADWSARGVSFVPAWDGVARAFGAQAEAREPGQRSVDASSSSAVLGREDGAASHEPASDRGFVGEAAVEGPSQGGAGERAPSAASAADRAAQLAALRETLLDCRLCRLAQGRTQVVFGVGNPAARLLFVGEGPGRDEDLQGEPFVGKAGQLLTDIIEKGMGLRRSDVYICNVVKCRPPGNRDPELDEVAACHPFLARQVEIVAPEVIVSLGRVASQALLATARPISQIRGRWHEYAGIPLMPTLHPAYLLRNPGDKRLVWSDVKQVMERLELPVPRRS